METVKLVYRFKGVPAEHVVEFKKKLFTIGATGCESHRDGDCYVVTATVPTMNEYDA